MGRKGWKHSEETKRKIGLGNKGKVITQEQRDKISKSLMGRPSPNKGKVYGEEVRRKMSESKKGSTAWNKGRKMTPEESAKMSEIQKRLWSDPTYRAEQLVRMSRNGKTVSDETRQKMSIASKEMGKREDIKKIRSETCRKLWSDPAFRKRRSIEQSQKSKEMWSDPAMAQKIVERIFEASRVSPNKSELKLQNVLEKLFPNEWKFVGGGQLIIGGKCPDFVNVNGQKKIIELFGSFWHEESDEQKRVDTFAELGYKTLIIWEKELKDLNTLSERIKAFSVSS